MPTISPKASSTKPVVPSPPLASGSLTEPGDESAASVAAEPFDATGDRTPAPDDTDRPIPRPIAEGPGTKMGPYKLREKIGEGVMGVVYLAEQEKPVRRRVALKIIKPGTDTEQVVTRFEAERQALALMDHPSIARVFDAGATDTGRPYFVMELVKRVPITEYCDTVHMTPRERLELFIPVCQAIQHAHQKGIIHRDVKPSNVLVAMQDGKPVPKIIDFGVAKATEQRLTERSLFTQHGTIVGTLEYMSPEQAEMSAMDIDTRTDVYALGVLLYELFRRFPRDNRPSPEGRRRSETHPWPRGPATLESQNELALAYQSAGRTADAIANGEETLKLLTAKLGPDHPATIASRNNLALTYAAVGRRADAIAMQEESLRLSTSKLGPNHPDTLSPFAASSSPCTGKRRRPRAGLWPAISQGSG